MGNVAALVRERFGELSDIQKAAIPKVLEGQNVLILAPTGSGKTEAALLPILEKIKPLDGGICALYITPLRSLNRDLLKRFSWWCERLDISHGVRHGDTTQHERTKQRKNPPKILLTTIESVQALLMGRVMRQHLQNIKFVIVDEIHDTIDNKRGAQLSLGLERLAEISDFRRIGISATVARQSDAARIIFGKRDYSVCEAGRNRKMDISVENYSSQEKKIARIAELSKKNRSLIFVNTRSAAEEIGASLIEKGAPVEVHHGSLDKDLRMDSEDRFKSGKLRSIICTSSLELGIDVGDVDLVIQLGSPHQVSRLIQRVGRSGHSLSSTPRGIMMSSDFDDELECEVIRIFASNGWIEHKEPEIAPLDVIAHQLIGLTLDFGRMDLANIHKILSRSGIYGIDYRTLRRIALQLHSEGLLFFDESENGQVMVRAMARARTYYYSYLSTIPKMKRYIMKDITSNRIISSLDEEFVISLGDGASFLSKGKPWRVVDITDDEVLAEPGAGNDIAIPAWTGEDIPVPFEVGQEAGRLRRSLKKNISPIADNKNIVIEIIEDLIIVHACLGSKVNEGIGRMFSSNLSRLVGESVRAVTDPYRILVKLPFPLKREHVVSAFSFGNTESKLRQCLAGSLLLRMKFLHIGRLFGLLSEDATVGKRFIEAMRNSVVYEEAERFVFSHYFDVQKTSQTASKIKSGEIGIHVVESKEPGFFGKIGISRFSGGESMGGFEPRAEMIRAFRENSLSRTVRLRCLSCGAERFLHIAGAPDRIVCHNCTQPSYAMVPMNKSGKNDDVTPDMRLSAALIREFGKRGIIALSAYGIGPRTADRILRKLHKSEDAFYLDLMDAQKHFIKNKKFWKPS
jgi:ATP-dependent Lhr-like helicase